MYRDELILLKLRMGDSDVNGLWYERRVEKLKFSLYTTDEEIHNCVTCNEVWLKQWF